MVSTALSIVSKIGEYVAGPIGRQFGYLLFCERNLENLRNQVQNLETSKAAMQLLADAAERKREDILPDVKNWLEKASECSKEARRILQDESEASKLCLKWCPNFKSRYSLSRKAKKKAQEVVEFLQQRQNFTVVAAPAPPPPIESTFEKGNKSFESRAFVMGEIMEALKNDNVNMIGICGMGGVGKTTVVEEVIKRANEEKLFDQVVMATVSQSPNFMNIQSEIKDNLGITFEKESEFGRAVELFATITAINRILIVLDDVWQRIELNKIGIPSAEDHKGCKILLTSRNSEVVEGMKAQNIFIIQVLPEEEAWSLFKESAGISNDEIRYPSDLLSKQKAIANECGGLPLAIVCVARALRGKGEHSWDYALSQLRHAIVKNIGEVAKEVHKPLEFSYNQLSSEEAKKCFLLCSMYGEDFNIPIEDLVKYGFSLELFEGIESIGQARSAVHHFVDNLKRCNLLMDGCTIEHIKMHDVIRDVAISIASRKKHPFVVRCDGSFQDWAQKEKNKHYPVITFNCRSDHKLPDNLDFPELKLLRIESNFKSPEIPDSLYERMTELKVVALSRMFIQSLPTSLGCLSSLHTLSLHGCRVNGKMPVIGQMKNLEILSFYSSFVEELPIEIGHLTRLKSLDLYRCEVGKFFPGVLSNLSSLEELYMGNVKSAFLEHITELSSMSNLVTLCIFLHDINLWPKNWTPEKIKNFHIRVGSLLWPEEHYFMKNILDVRNVDLRGSGFGLPAQHTKHLCLSSIGDLKDIFCDLGEDDFGCLTFLRLKNCHNIEYLINGTHGAPHRAFPVLESLTLYNLNKFREICHAQPLKELSNAMTNSFLNFKAAFAALRDWRLINLPELIGRPLWRYESDLQQQQQQHGPPLPPTQIGWLSNLTYMTLKECNKLQSIFSVPMARGLVQLQEVVISKCKTMEAVIIPGEGGDNYKALNIRTEKEDRIVFPKLERLLIEELPNFTVFCKIISPIEMPQLKQLQLSYLSKMTSLSLPSSPTKEANNDPIIQSFFKVALPSIEDLKLSYMDNLMKIWPGELQVEVKLIKLKVKMCPILLNVFPSSKVIQCMPHLEEVQVKDCQSMEVAFESIVSLPMLKILDLCHLPKLTHVWKISTAKLDDSLSFRNLYSIKIYRCANLRNIFPTCVAKLLRSLKKLEIVECEATEVIVAVDDCGHDNEGTSPTSIILLPQLKCLEFISLPNLRSLCPQGFTFVGSCLEELKAYLCPKIEATLECMLEQKYWGIVNEVKIMPSSTDSHLLDGKLILTGKDREQLFVVGEMDEPTDIWYKKVEEVHGCFDKVKHMLFQYCGKLLSVTSSNLIPRKNNLESLVVWKCESMEAILDFKGTRIEEESRIKILKLSYLPKLIHIWKNMPQQNHHYFQNLAHLIVESCDSLRYIFTVSMAKTLVNLEELSISRCEKLEKIISRAEGEREDEEPLQFLSSNCWVKLRYLPNLICFGPGENDGHFLVSRRVKVVFCRKYKGPGFKFP